MSLNSNQAFEVIAEAGRKSAELGLKMCIAVVDAGANLVAFMRMDGAWLGSVDIAIKKAKTARFFNMDTKMLSPLTQPGQPLYGIEHSNQGLVTFAGGVTIKNEQDEVIGAIGVSGDTVENDHLVAQAGAAVYE
jgi:uncharacterized protein GlcG (DUF336 family)